MKNVELRPASLAQLLKMVAHPACIGVRIGNKVIPIKQKPPIVPVEIPDNGDDI